MPGRMEDFGYFLSRTFASTRPRRKTWPFVSGSYFVIDPAAPVAVTTLGSVALAEEVSRNAPAGLNIVGKVETENIGIEKIVKNVISNPTIRYFICAGTEPPRHLTGATLIAMHRNGIDDSHRIPGAPGMRPFMPNTSAAEVLAFREQVELVDMIGCTDVAAIHARVGDLARLAGARAESGFRPLAVPGQQGEIERIVAVGTDPKRINLDRAGYFVIHIDGDLLLAEHYDYKDRLLRIVEGQDARSIYLTLVRNGWVSALDHAAYIGKELARAEASMKAGIGYVQDGA